MSQRISNRYGQTRSTNRFDGSQSRVRIDKQLQEEEIRLQHLRDEEFRLQQQRLRDEVMRLTQQERNRMERERDLMLARDEARKIQNEYTRNLAKSSSTVNKGKSLYFQTIC
jgi:hypothetical protein